MSTPNATESLSTPDDPVDPVFPTETEIYLLPSGEVIVADLPAELDAALRTLGERLPDELEAAFAADSTARALFDAMPPSHRREAVAYVTEAKKPETRVKRSAQTLQWLHDGKIGAKRSKRK